MLAEYNYAATAGYSRARFDWESWPSRNTIVRRGDINRWDQAIYDLKHTVCNVKDFGALGDGTTDDYAAIVAAYNAVPTGGGVVHFPPGNYKVGTALSFTSSKPVALTGPATLTFSFAAGDAITINGPTYVSVRELTLAASVTRTSTTYFLKVVSASETVIEDVVTGSATAAVSGGGIHLSGCNSPRLHAVRSNSLTGSALRLAAVSGLAASDSTFATGAALSTQPAVWLTGNATSNTFTNCHFGGCGPALSYNISGITSTGANFTVTTSATHALKADDFVVIRGASVAAYNDMWRIASVTATTIVVTSALNPGTATATGTAECVSACFYVDNSNGSCNESMIANCIFETGASPVYGIAGAYFNGRNGTGNTVVQGWTITGCYFDLGMIGLLIASMDANASHQMTAYGFSIGDNVFAGKARAIHLERVGGVTLDNNSLDWPSGSYVLDKVSAMCGLYIYAGASDAQARGITVRGNNFGWPRDFGYFGQNFATYGIVLDGAGIQDLVIVGNQIGGTTSPFGLINTPLAAGQRWKIVGNTLASGALPVNNTTYLVSVASAATVDLSQPYETYKITGTTTITSITGGWIGREIRLLFASDTMLGTGGNLSVIANRHVRAGEVVEVVFDGTNWCVAGDPSNSPDVLAQQAYGLKAWTHPLVLSLVAGTLTSQKLFFTAIPLRAGDVVTNFVVNVVTAATGAVPSTIKIALFNSDGSSRLAVTGNLASDAKWTSTGYKSFAASSPATVTTTGLYLVAILKDGVFAGVDVQVGTMSAVASASSGALGVFPWGFGGTGLTDIGSTFTPAPGTGPPWFGLS